MIPDCISFNAIPHTTRIFSDFLSYSPAVQKFFPTQPDAEHIAAFAKSVPRNDARQAHIADALEKQNRAWGASEATLRNVQRLRDGAFAIVTGQQVGLFGGPLLALFKVASALALAKQVEALGVECVPVFWLASEDHDLAEVNQSLLLTHDFQLVPFKAPTRSVDGAPVSTIRFAEGMNDAVKQAAELLGESLAADYLRESYAEGETFSNAYALIVRRHHQTANTEKVPSHMHMCNRNKGYRPFLVKGNIASDACSKFPIQIVILPKHFPHRSAAPINLEFNGRPSSFFRSNSIVSVQKTQSGSSQSTTS